jgi:hypothetical protein
VPDATHMFLEGSPDPDIEAVLANAADDIVEGEHKMARSLVSRCPECLRARVATKCQARQGRRHQPHRQQDQFSCRA